MIIGGVALLGLLGLLGARAGKPVSFWHITDVHVDPWYTLNADATR